MILVNVLLKLVSFVLDQQFTVCLLCFYLFHVRVTLLELLSAQLGEEDTEECGIPSEVARFLACCFQKGCGAVLTLACDSATDDEVHAFYYYYYSNISIEVSVFFSINETKQKHIQ